MTAAKHRAIDHVRRSSMLDRKHGELGYAVETARPDTAAQLERGARRRHRRRPAAPGVHRVPPRAHHRSPRRADAAAARRPHDQPRSPGPFSRPSRRLPSASCAPRRRWRRSSVPYEVPRGAELAARLSSVLEVIYLIFNEGLLGDGRRRLDAAGALRRRAAAGAHPRRARAARARSARARGADGDPGVAGPRARRARAAPRCCCSIRTARSGISC